MSSRFKNIANSIPDHSFFTLTQAGQFPATTTKKADCPNVVAKVFATESESRGNVKTVSEK